MKSKLLLVLSILTTGFLSAQWTIDFEDTDPAYVYVLGQQGTGQTTATVVDNPNGTTGNDTGLKVAQFTVNSNIGSWAYPFIQLNGGGTTWNDALGKFFHFKFLSPITSGDIKLYLWVGGVKQAAVSTSFTGGSMTNWNIVEFDTSVLGISDGYLSRVDIEFSAGVNLVAGHVYYFDDLVQETSSILGTNTIDGELKNVFPNPTSGVLQVSGLEMTDSVSIYDFSGKRVSYFAPGDRIDISHLNPGVYFLRASNGVNTKVFKI